MVNAEKLQPFFNLVQALKDIGCRVTIEVAEELHEFGDGYGKVLYFVATAQTRKFQAVFCSEHNKHNIDASYPDLNGRICADRHVITSNQNILWNNYIYQNEIPKDENGLIKVVSELKTLFY